MPRVQQEEGVVSVFYNDIDRRACATLREMIGAGLIADGDVDGRDVATIQPRELAGYDRVHLFAGIGGFEFAARLAGWPDGVQLWTGGFPCQPFSVAGRREGAGDDRYLWPEFERLIRGCRPEFVLIENVSAIDSEPDLVLDRVCVDLEALGYEVGPPCEIPACAVDAAHERNRVWIMANRDQPGLQERGGIRFNAGAQRTAVERGGAGGIGWVACHDGRFRRIPLGLLDPAVVLAHGLPSRTLALHGLGNSIHPEVAAETMKAMLWSGASQ